jgi:hypothetical protein
MGACGPPSSNTSNLYQKSLLRRSLVLSARPGAAYVPFIGDGDLALAHYAPKGFSIYGADIDQGRVETAQARLPGHTIVKADCNDWPFPKVRRRFTLADFDAYSEPYPSFRAFWERAPKGDPLVLIFTDGHMQGVKRSGWLLHPSGERLHLEDLRERRRTFNFYWQRTVKPWLEDYIRPWRVVRSKFYIRATNMLYFGAVITRAKS